MADISDYAPQLVGQMNSTVGGIIEHSGILLSFIIAFIVLFFIYKLMTHRILVEKLTKVKGGFVISTGRYKLDFDKKTKRPSMVSMFGNERLPPFNSDYFQKMRGIPFIGCMRSISLVFLNKYSPLVSLPGGEIKHIDVKRWQYDNQKGQFIQERRKGDLVYFLSIYAPAVIIIGAIVFWIVCIILQINMTEWYADELKETLLRLGGYGGP